MLLFPGTSAPWTGQIIVTEEEPAGMQAVFIFMTPGDMKIRRLTCSSTFWSLEGIIPEKPQELQVTEATKNYLVLSWKPPGEKGLEGVMYYVEKVNMSCFLLIQWCHLCTRTSFSSFFS